MKFSDYMKDNQITLLVCFAGGLFFSVLLLAFGISLSEMALLWVSHSNQQVEINKGLLPFYNRKLNTQRRKRII